MAELFPVLGCLRTRGPGTQKVLWEVQVQAGTDAQLRVRAEISKEQTRPCEKFLEIRRTTQAGDRTERVREAKDSKLSQ